MATDYPKPDSLLVGTRGVGKPFDLIYVKTPTLTPVAVAATTITDQEFAVTGVAVGDYVVMVNYPEPTNNANPVMAQSTEINTIAVMYVNPTSGSLTPPSGQYTFLIFRPSSNPSL